MDGNVGRCESVIVKVKRRESVKIKERGTNETGKNKNECAVREKRELPMICPR